MIAPPEALGKSFVSAINGQETAPKAPVADHELVKGSHNNA